MARRQRQLPAGIGAARCLTVGVAVARGEVQPAREARRGGQLHPAHPRLPGLDVEAGVGGIGGEGVALVDLIGREGQQQVGPARLVLHPDLDLLARARLEGRAAGGGADDRVEGGRIGDIGRDADIEHVVEPDATGEGGSVLVRAGAGQPILGVAVHPVMATAQGQDPAVPADLVLQVDAKLVLHLVGAEADRRGGIEGAAIDRREGVYRRGLPDPAA